MLFNPPIGLDHERTIANVFLQGNITGEALIGKIAVGNATIDALTLKPGNQTYKLEARAFFDVVSENIEELLRIEYPYLRQGLVAAGVRGKSVVYNGQHLPYWEEALRTIDLVATRDAKSILKQALPGTLMNIIGEAAGELQGLSALMGQGGIINSGLDLIIDAGLRLIASFPEDPTMFLNIAVPLCRVILAALPALGF